VPAVGGNLRQFRAGQLHHLALEVPIEDHFMGGIVNKYFGKTTNDPATAIIAFRDALAKRGIQLLVVPAPNNCSNWAGPDPARLRSVNGLPPSNATSASAPKAGSRCRCPTPHDDWDALDASHTASRKTATTPRPAHGQLVALHESPIPLRETASQENT
jgi:hypothetical protein